MQDDEGRAAPARRPRLLGRLARAVDGSLQRALGLLGAGLLMAMMLVTFGDVVGRNLGRPIPGAKEATQVMLAALVFVMLPLVTRVRGHIAVDLLDSFVSERLKALQEVAICAMGALALYFGAQALHMLAARAFRLGDRVAFIGVPTGPIVTFMAIACTLAAAAFALNGALALWRVVRGPGHARPNGGE